MTRSVTSRAAATILAIAMMSSCSSSSPRRATETRAERIDECRLLSFDFGQQSRDPSQRHVDLVFTNDSLSGTCSLMSDPEVDLIGPAWSGLPSVHAVVWHLRSDDAKAAKLILRENASVHLPLTYSPTTPGDDHSWTPDYIVVPSQNLALPWNYGPITYQEMATHPGTYVGHVLSGRG